MSTYSTNLALELIGTGEQAGVWGTTTNTNLGTLIEQAISGYVTQAVATGTDTTITIPNGATGVARNMYIELTGTGGTNTNLIVPANKKLYFIFNNSTGAVTVKVSGQTGVSVPTGKKMVLVSNGTDIVNGLNYIADFGSNSATITQLTATSATITNLTLTSLVISNLSIASANITTLTGSTQTLSGNLTLSGGTANGVLYLNGSKVATSGSALVFDGTNLGIGTSSPVGKLQVTGSLASFILNTSGTEFYNNYAGQIKIYASNAAGFLSFGAGGRDNDVVISTAGNLGVGTSSITAGYRGQFEGDSAAAAISVGVRNTNTTGISRFVLGNNIGQARFTIGYTGSTASAPFGASLAYIGTEGAEPIVFQTNGTERMRLDSSGNLGIGTSSPKEKLDSRGAAVFSGDNATGTNAYGTAAGLLLSTSSDSTKARITAVSNGANSISLVLRPLSSGSAVDAVTIDSSGNLGLGATPSAWGGTSGVLQNSAGALWRFSTNNIYIGQNYYYNGTNRIYINSAEATEYQQTSGQHRWFTAASGTAGNAISFTQAMTLDASGNLLVGATGQAFAEKFRMYGNYAVFDDGTYSGLLGRGTQLGTGTASDFAIRSQNALAFLTNGGNERARITSGGQFKVGATPLADVIGWFDNSHASTPYGLYIDFSAASPDNNSEYFFRAEDSTAVRCYIWSDGDLANHDGVYGTISDARLKQDIVDAPSQWDDLKAVRFRKYRMKTDVDANPDAPSMLGVVAQELEQVCPGLVDEHTDTDGETTKTVKSSILLMKAAVALQEAMSRIEQLEAKVAALENK